MVIANQLRIGNLVQDVLQLERVLVVYSVEPQVITCHVSDFTYPYLDEYLEPIPLTPEHLQKAGFLAHQGGWMDSRIGNISQGSAGYYLDDNESGSVNFKPLLYLHELQNLYFVIVGEDLIYTP